MLTPKGRMQPIAPTFSCNNHLCSDQETEGAADHAHGDGHVRGSDSAQAGDGVAHRDLQGHRSILPDQTAHRGGEGRQGNANHYITLHSIARFLAQRYAYGCFKDMNSHSADGQLTLFNRKLFNDGNRHFSMTYCTF